MAQSGERRSSRSYKEHPTPHNADHWCGNHNFTIDIEDAGAGTNDSLIIMYARLTSGKESDQIFIIVFLLLLMLPLSLPSLLSTQIVVLRMALY